MARVVCAECNQVIGDLGPGRKDRISLCEDCQQSVVNHMGGKKLVGSSEKEESPSHS